jgi:hypothetical protein
VPPDPKLEQAAQEASRSASVTIAEALMVRKLTGPPATVPQEIRKHVANMMRQNIALDRLHPTLRQRAEAMVRGGP